MLTRGQSRRLLTPEDPSGVDLTMESSSQVKSPIDPNQKLIIFEHGRDDETGKLDVATGGEDIVTETKDSVEDPPVENEEETANGHDNKTEGTPSKLENVEQTTKSSASFQISTPNPIPSSGNSSPIDSVSVINIGTSMGSQAMTKSNHTVDLTKTNGNASQGQPQVFHGASTLPFAPVSQSTPSLMQPTAFPPRLNATNPNVTMVNQSIPSIGSASSLSSYAANNSCFGVNNPMPSPNVHPYITFPTYQSPAMMPQHPQMQTPMMPISQPGPMFNVANPYWGMWTPGMPAPWQLPPQHAMLGTNASPYMQNGSSSSHSVLPNTSDFASLQPQCTGNTEARPTTIVSNGTLSDAASLMQCKPTSNEATKQSTQSLVFSNTETNANAKASSQTTVASEMSVPSYHSQTSNTSFSKHRKHKEPPMYNGDVSVDYYLEKFDEIADWNGWNDTDKAQQLRFSLSGKMEKALNSVPVHLKYDFGAVKKALRQFKGEDIKVTEEDFWKRTKLPKETLQEYAAEIRDLFFSKAVISS